VCVIQPIGPDCISALPGDVRMVGVLGAFKYIVILYGFWEFHSDVSWYIDQRSP
jgi:hypothetical protein